MDIVESLRAAAAQPDCPNPLVQKEAADEIETLRGRLAHVEFLKEQIEKSKSK